MSMDSSRDVEDYLQSMLDLSNPEHRQFVEILLNQLGHSYDTSINKNGNIPPIKQQANGKTQQKSLSKKKTKQINLFSAEGKAKENITLPGQHRWVILQIPYQINGKKTQFTRLLDANARQPSTRWFKTASNVVGSYAPRRAPDPVYFAIQT